MATLASVDDYLCRVIDPGRRVLLLPLSEKIEMLYLLRLMMGVGKVAMITAVPIVVTTRFSRRFATAMAIVWAGGATGGFLLSPLTNLLLQNVGWRTAATVIGCGLIVGVGLIAMLAKGSAASTWPTLPWSIESRCGTYPGDLRAASAHLRSIPCRTSTRFPAPTCSNRRNGASDAAPGDRLSFHLVLAGCNNSVQQTWPSRPGRAEGKHSGPALHWSR